MKPGIPWSVKGVEPEVRAAAKTAARRAGMTLGEWLNSVILDQNEHIIDSLPPQTLHPEERRVSSAPQSPGAASRDEQPRAIPSRRDDSALRLQDIAQQLADLAQKERQSAPPPAYAPSRRRMDEEEAFARLLERIDDNERQTVEAFSAVNERLSKLGQQIAALPRTPLGERPEDVPGYATLESALRNMVEHIEVSEKRTRESLKAMQDRLVDLADRAERQPKFEDLQRNTPVIAAIEARVTELSNRLLRAETTLQSGLPEAARREVGQLAERLESIRAAAEQMSRNAQSAALGTARTELREMEERLLARLRETQAEAGTKIAQLPEFGKLRSEMGTFTRRLEEVKSGSASERDFQTLRIAVEQLSARVAQGADLRSLSEMERRLGDLHRKVEQLGTAPAGGGHVHDLESRIASIGERVSRSEEQLRHVETMERAIRQLYEALEQGRSAAGQVAEEAASRTVERLMSGGAPMMGPSAELSALEEGLRALRESAAGAERRNQETLAAVHETLSQIVEKITELEQGGSPRRAAPAAAAAPATDPMEASARYSAEAYAQGYAEQRAQVSGTASPMMPPPAAEPASPITSGDDFIAAARRAAQAAAARPSALRAEFAPTAQPIAEEKGGFFSRLRGKPAAAPAPAPAMPEAAPAQKGRSRYRLLMAGALLLAAAAAAVVGVTGRNAVAPVFTPDPAVQAPAPSVEPQKQGSLAPVADPIITGSVPATAVAAPVEMPPPALGPESLRTAAMKGDAVAQFLVASRYLNGEGIPQDAARAALWFERAAGQGLAVAQYRLGTLYERGMGVAQDAAAALAWYEKAAGLGNVKAMHNAAVLAVGGEAGNADYARAFALFTAAAQRGLRDSQFNLAILYERGLGTRADSGEAWFWYSLAARQGDVHAGQRAAKIVTTLLPKRLAELTVRVEGWVAAPTDEAANVAAIPDPSWRQPANTVIASGIAEPLGPDAPAAPVNPVAEAQELLTRLGFNVGTADGRMGSRTANALKLFQMQSGLEVTGEITPEVLDVMRARAG